ncbi:hypothetical protein D9757_002903 [Collybiopsis confluens]|uniref:Anaphase-promoting complex subunit 4 n=1 Tax=Collybiopsis confluens TaxID=2823264 RepID=A0A8H5MDY5_9AGAR|nr:hypothetical protein D9757_002903 [Collybiopsis confluens]
MESSDFAMLAAVKLPAPSRLSPSACCPDKDLFVLVTRLGSYDRLSLWKLQGSKIWEVDVEESNRVVDIAWSPDGQSIAVAHDPPRITLHSIQNGRTEHVIPVPVVGTSNISQLTDIWWFHQEKPEKSPVPDIFRRDNIITGSVHSVLRILPLLDPLQDHAKQLTATDLFAFQGSQTSTRRPAAIPEVIKSWPALQSDPLLASINVPNPTRTMENGIIDEVDDTNQNSILSVADGSGRVTCFLDGTYSLGSFSTGETNRTVAALFKHPKRPIFLLHSHGESVTDLSPTHISLPLLEERKARDFAKLSSTARELCWYVMRVVEEMRGAWFGTETTTAAQELGPKWVQAYETKQRDKYNLKPSAMLDLTTLLLTDRATEALGDYLGSGQQMTERGLEKWDSAITIALVNLRDYSEKRLVPACQRLYLVLEEVRGWASLPTIYAAFDIPSETVSKCLIMLNQAILLASWLGAAARRELHRFREFMCWLRYETQILNPTVDTLPPIRHDILEVNKYFISGLEKSVIDKWFIGPVPTFAPQDVGIPRYDLSVNVALRKAREFLKARTPQAVIETPVDGFDDKAVEDRNLSALIGVFAECCREVFERPSGAATRTATVSRNQTRASSSAESRTELLFREKTKVEDGDYVEHLVMHAPSTSEHRSCVCFVRQRYGHNRMHVEVSVHECCLRLGDEEIRVDLLALEFFDEESLVMVYRTDQELQAPESSVRLSRESLIEVALQDLGAGQLGGSRYLSIKQSRGLKRCKTGTVSLAVNGRVGRRVACVLDNEGMYLETFDLEGDEGEDGEITLEEG